MPLIYQDDFLFYCGVVPTVREIQLPNTFGIPILKLLNAKITLTEHSCVNAEYHFETLSAFCPPSFAGRTTYFAAILISQENSMDQIVSASP